MINFIIKLLEKSTTFLKNIQLKSIESQKNLLDEKNINNTKWNKSITVAVLGMIFPIISIWSVLTISELNNIYLDIFLISFFIVLNILFILTLFKNLNWKYLFLVHFPLYVWIFSVLIAFNEYTINQFWLYNILLNAFLVIFPIIYISQYYIKFFRRKYIDIIKNTAYFYNIGFFLVITLNVLIISLWVDIQFIKPWTEVIIELIWENYIHWFFEWIMYLILLFIFLTFWVYTLHVYYDNIWHKRLNIHRAILVFLAVYCLWFTTTIRDYYYDYQVSKAIQIISTEWNNYKSHKNAQVLFLDDAILSQIKRWKYIDEEIFSKIFDDTISGYYGEKVADYTRDSRSFATDSSKTGDKADVVLQLAEITNKVYESKWVDKIPLLETTYKFHFTNETNTNQEVKLYFETPNKYSVVTGLRLWMDLELQWQVSPRGAALKVYEDSLIKNIDPALVEKVWLNTYSLRVFPIPSKTWTTGWRQLVEVKILSPIDKWDILYSPNFSLVNLKINKDSRLQSKIYNNNELIKEDVVKSNDIEKYLSTDHTLKNTELKIDSSKSLSDTCISPFIQSAFYMDYHALYNQKNIWNKINIFFDNSNSTNKNNINGLYKNIYDSIKNHDGKLNDIDLYSYNFDVTKLTWVEDINYWWYNDIDRVLDYIVNNNIKNEKIIIVTDDDNFNLTTSENTNRNVASLISNNISVIKIWKKVKTFKSDFNTIISATNGNIYNLDWKQNINDVVSKILVKNTDAIRFKDCTPPIVHSAPMMRGVNAYNPALNNQFRWFSWTIYFDETWAIYDNQNQYPYDENLVDKDVEKIQAWILGNLILWYIVNQQRWYEIANIQTTLAIKYSIVNQFNSLIALETTDQQNDLKNYENSSDKYDTNYDNNSWKVNTESTTRRRPINPGWAITNSIERWWINPWMWIDSSLRTSGWYTSSIWFDSSIGMSFWGRTEISIVWLLIIFIYLFEYTLFINFLIKYIKWEKNEKTIQNEIKQNKPAKKTRTRTITKKATTKK